MGVLKRYDSREWFAGPKFVYRGSGEITVNVTGSSWTLNGELAAGLLAVIRKYKKVGAAVLDFGAGSWLRYSKHIREKYSGHELFVVEYAEAFHGEAVAERDAMKNDARFWGPVDFMERSKSHFDLILLINVLNTIPEDEHRRAIFETLAGRLRPLGWLVVYQRVWAPNDKPKDAMEYGGGWIVPQPRYGYCTYRGRDGATWFNEQAKKAKLRVVDPKVEISSGNTLLRVWEKPLAV